VQGQINLSPDARFMDDFPSVGVGDEHKFPEIQLFFQNERIDPEQVFYGGLCIYSSSDGKQ
jgi:hypothetical protein